MAGAWIILQKDSNLFFSKGNSDFPKGRPQGHPDGKSLFPVDKRQRASFAKVYRRISTANPRQAKPKPTLTAQPDATITKKTLHPVTRWIFG